MILVVSSIALSLPRWQSSDSRATKINSDREGGGGRFANGLSAGTSLSSGWRTCRTAPSAPRSIKTNLYRHSSDNANRSASATAASLCLARTLPGASARKPTRACSVKRDRLEVKPMAHMVLGPSRVSRRWRLALPPRQPLEGSRRVAVQGVSSARCVGPWSNFLGVNGLPYLSFRNRAAPSVFGSPKNC